MQSSPIRDLVVGLFVLSGFVALGYLTFQIGGLSDRVQGGFELFATFDEIGGLRERAPITISGVKVGQVKSVELDDFLRARVRMDVDPGLELPVDSSVAIRTSGLLGDQYIALEPGAEDDILQRGEEIAYTESALSIERLIGKFMNDADLDEE
jgi:phospholipid/cholesterol/gamma-HCH transport system substrate-binding protein